MGAPIKFIHCSDLHLGSRFVGIFTEDSQLGKKMVSSTFDALEKIVQKANSEVVDFVLFAGDIFDDSDETPYTRNRFVDAISRIKAECFIVYGNHDYKRKWENEIPLPSNAHVFGGDVGRFTYPLNNPNAEIEIFGISFTQKTCYENLAAKITGNKDYFSIGLVHCDLDGEDRSVYAPCKVSDLLNKNIDYWALGHIHKRKLLHKEKPLILYPGNTQGRNIKETGEKGAYLITVQDKRIKKAEFFKTSVIDWCEIQLEINSETKLSDLIDELKEKTVEGSFLKIIIEGSGPLNHKLRLERQEIIDIFESESKCKCSSLILHTSPEIDLNERAKGGDFISAVLEYNLTLSSLRKEELIDIICSIPSSSSIRNIFEEMDADELRELVNTSTRYIIEKMREADGFEN